MNKKILVHSKLVSLNRIKVRLRTLYPESASLFMPDANVDVPLLVTEMSMIPLYSKLLPASPHASYLDCKRSCRVFRPEPQERDLYVQMALVSLDDITLIHLVPEDSILRIGYDDMEVNEVFSRKFTVSLIRKSSDPDHYARLSEESDRMQQYSDTITMAGLPRR